MRNYTPFKLSTIVAFLFGSIVHAQTGLSTHFESADVARLTKPVPENSVEQRETSSASLLDSDYNWMADTSLSIWLSAGKHLYTYDATGNLARDVFLAWTGSALTNWVQLNYTYDARNNLISTLLQSWVGNSWVDHYREGYEFDDSNHLIKDSTQYWEGTKGWVNNAQYIYTYENNKEISSLSQVWLVTYWSNGFLSSFTYDANNRLSTTVVQNWYNNNWVLSSEEFYFYDANGNLIKDSTQERGKIYWASAYQDIYTYDGNNNKTYHLSQLFADSSWINTNQYFYSYASSHLIQSIQQLWEGAWENYDQNFFTYDDFSNQISDKQQLWNVSHWVNSDSIHYYYSASATGIVNTSKDNASVKVFPNPTTNEIFVDYSSAQTEAGTVDIYNLSGKLLLSSEIKTGQKGVHINVQNLVSGTYVLKFQNSRGYSIVKVVKE